MPSSPAVRALIDFGRPVGLLLIAILHHVEKMASGGNGRIKQDEVYHSFFGGVARKK
jgi:S-adenosyl methyltransferase